MSSGGGYSSYEYGNTIHLTCNKGMLETWNGIMFDGGSIAIPTQEDVIETVSAELGDARFVYDGDLYVPKADNNEHVADSRLLAPWNPIYILGEQSSYYTYGSDIRLYCWSLEFVDGSKARDFIPVKARGLNGYIMAALYDVANPKGGTFGNGLYFANGLIPGPEV